jgi:hypothetical protein
MAGIGKNAFSILEQQKLLAHLKEHPERHSITIESYDRFYPTSAKHLAIFKPVESILRLIDERTSGFDEHTIGVHVRRTDNIKSIERSPDDAFIALMENEIDLQSATRFYLATDAIEVKAKFKQRFGERILTTPFKASRTDPEGIREAVAELYTLAATAKILGSYWSSYSTTAAEIGNIRRITVSKEE